MQWKTLCVIAYSDGTAANAAQYRITGLPPEWPVVVENAPTVSTAVGNILGLGANLVFADCQSPNEADFVHLQTLRVFATSPIFDIVLQVERALRRTTCSIRPPSSRSARKVGTS
jgi:hypothetical protein